MRYAIVAIHRVNRRVERIDNAADKIPFPHNVILQLALLRDVSFARNIAEQFTRAVVNR
jgi:hypothetical protein